ncbi:MAG: tRNA (adenosine(37)-N6)-dimethylallyltransferase MiaA [Anderseniella sp.]
MGNTQLKSAILIAGPTASGKSAVAMDVAERLNGVVINADAMQVYAELDVLTSRPSRADEARVAHRLFGCAPAGDAWSAGRWLEAANTEISLAWQAGKVPVLAGGTGLYFKVLEEGLSPIPKVPDNIRDYWRGRLQQEGAHVLHGELARIAADDAARIEPADGQRIVRALEVHEATGKPLCDHFAAARQASVLADAQVRRVALMPPREELYRSCDARFDAMLDCGAVGEVERLLASGLAPDLPAMKAIGVQALAAHLAGEAKIEVAIALAQRQTRNYAKRQMTWIRNQMTDWPKAETRQQALEVLLK